MNPALAPAGVRMGMTLLQACSSADGRCGRGNDFFSVWDAKETSYAIFQKSIVCPAGPSLG